MGRSDPPKKQEGLTGKKEWEGLTLKLGRTDQTPFPRTPSKKKLGRIKSKNEVLGKVRRTDSKKL